MKSLSKKYSSPFENIKDMFFNSCEINRAWRLVIVKNQDTKRPPLLGTVVLSEEAGKQGWGIYHTVEHAITQCFGTAQDRHSAENQWFAPEPKNVVTLLYEMWREEFNIPRDEYNDYPGWQ